MQPTKLYLGVGLSIALVALCGRPAAWAGEEPPDPDEQFLRECGIGTDAASLLEFLRQRSPADVDAQNLGPLIQQLGHPDFKKREEASRKLLNVGLIGLEPLRKAMRDPDKEIAKRAAQLLEKFEHDDKWGLPLAAVRRLRKLRADGALEVLLRYLPYAAHEETVEEIWYGLDALAVCDGKADSSLVAALKDNAPARRAAAACILGRVGNAEQRAAVGKLLEDTDAIVRLRAAQGLLAAKDKAALSVLVRLLGETDTAVSWQAEELLHYVAGDQAPEETVGAGTMEMRTKCRAAWEAWQTKYAAKLDLAELDQQPRRPRLVLVCGSAEDRADTPGRVSLFGCTGKARWGLRTERPITDVQLLPHNRVLLAERWQPPRNPQEDEDLPDQITERDFTGRALWQQGGAFARAESCRRLANGNTFIFSGARWLEINSEGKQIFPAPDERRRKAGGGIITSAYKLDNGHVLCWAALDAPALVEVDGAGTRVFRTVPIKVNVADHSSLVAPSGAGRFLLSLSKTQSLFEIDGSGEGTWRTRVERLGDAAPVRSGNLLVVAYAPVPRVFEMARNGKVPWEALPDFLPRRVHTCLDLVAFGIDTPKLRDFDVNSVNWQIKLLKDKDPKVRHKAALVLEGFGPRARSAISALVAALDDPDARVRHAVVSALAATGVPALPQLTDALKRRDSEARIACVDAIGRFGAEAKAAVGPLMDLLEADDNPRLRERVLIALGAIAPENKGVMAALINALSDNDKQIRWSVAMALEHMGPVAKPAVPALVQALNGEDERLRILAAVALGSIKVSERKVIDALIDHLGHNETASVRANAARAVGNLGVAGKAAIPQLVEACKATGIKDPEAASDLQSQATWALGQMGPDAKAAVPMLIELVQDRTKDRGPRCEAAEALGNIGPAAQGAVPVLARVLAEAKLSLDNLLRDAVEGALDKLKGAKAP